jgi:carbon monoxide dehydrogenase subunit G
MDFSGEFTVQAKREAVYSLLIDGKRMATILPGVESVEVADGETYKATVRIGVSFIKGRFNIRLRIKEKREPEHVEIEGSGTGAGSSATFKGYCDLIEKDGSTNVRWFCTVDIGGLAASAGNRMLQGAAQRYIDELIASFKKSVT